MKYKPLLASKEEFSRVLIDSKLCEVPLLTSVMSDSPYSVESIYFPKHSKERKYTAVGCNVCGVRNKTLYKVGENRYCAQCKSSLRSDDE